ncbi:hypothetical protein PMO31116_03072 [Pandoraea morbifera]|uniref:BIG2 domain-containing protein n=1 Tax=Pandoraea morbifera TaxID=2508300 RepID=A0A5E4W8W9_9BURK|nr:hypothetical protein [Pandoraea morbifera]VVE20319.1 hypothetical protein PMO31116_03072 [Pandoraea morbifera]
MNIRDRFAEGGGIVLEGDEATDKSARLFAPTVPAARKGGIRKDDLESNINDKLEVLVPWATGFLRGDMLLLYWGLPGVPIDTIQIDNPNDSVFTLMAPVTDIARVGDGLIDVWYERISSFGDPVPIESPHVQVLVKTDVPGGNDPDQSTWPINEGLAEAILPPGPIETVPPEGLPVEIPMWENMAAGDVVTIFWGSAQGVVHRPITEAEVGQPVVVMVPEAIIIEAGAGEGVAVTYELVDKVQNWSGRAPSAFIDVEVGDAIYDAPAVAGLNDDNELDYDGLNGDDVTVVVMKNNDMAAGDGVSLVFQGRSYEGLEVEHTQTLTLSGTVMMFDLPNETLGQVVPGQGSVFYRVSTAGVYKGRSYRAPFAITGAAVGLPAPKVLEATADGELDPAAVPNGATVEVEPWQGYGVGDLVRLRWNGFTSGGDPISHADIYEITQENITERVRFVVPYSRIGPIAGGRVEVHYTVESGNSQRTSETLTLEVLGVASLEPPIVEGEVGGELDPALVPDGAKLTIPKWPDMAPGDVVNWFWLGLSDGGQATGEATVETVGDIVATVPRGVIEANANGGDTVNVLYRVTRVDGTEDTSLPKSFVVLPVSALLPPPHVEEEVDGVLDPNDALDDATVRVDAYEGMARNDIVTIWFAKGTIGEATRRVQISDGLVGQPLYLYVPHESVEMLDGLTVTVNYTVEVAGVEKRSEDLMVEVSKAVVWPAPEVREADGDYLPEDAYARGANTIVRWHTSMRVGDTIDLYWGEGAEMYHDTLDILGPMDYEFFMRKEQVDTWLGREVPVRYTIKRGNRVMPSEVLHLRVGVELPTLTAPVVVEAIDDVLKPVDVRQGATVRIAYDGMQADDIIQLNWDGDVSFAAVSGNASGSVDVVVPPGKIALNLGETILVSYTVDRLGFETVSPALELTINNFLPGNLPLPTVVQQKGGVLNLMDFTGDATARVPAWPLMAAGQRVWWRVFGTLSTGNSMTISLELGHEVTDEEAGKPLERVLRRSDLEKLLDGSDLRIQVKVTFDGSASEADAVTFRERTLKLAHSLTLPAPVVLEAPDDEIDPIEAEKGVTVRVSYEDMRATDRIKLVLDGADAFDEVPGSTTGSVDIPVPGAMLIPYVGRSVKISYIVTRAGNYDASGILELTVNDFGEGELPTPVIPQAQNGVLKLDSFTGDAEIKVAPWPLIAAGQKVWLRCHATLANGTPDVIVLLIRHVVTAGEATSGISQPLPRARLAALRNDSELRVEFKVAFDGDDDELQAVIFPLLRVTMQVVPPITVDPNKMVLNGFSVKSFWNRTGAYPPGNSQTRAASGGVPPYTYSSNKPAVATVNSSGRVVGEGNGTATITVRDSKGATATYTVEVSNVYTTIDNHQVGISPAQAIAWRSSLPGGRGIGMTEIESLRVEYTNIWPANGGYFTYTCEQGSCGAGWCYAISQYGVNLFCTHKGTPNGSFCKAICLIPKNG